MAEGPAVAPARGFLDEVIDSVFTPGAGPGLAATVNGSLVLLIGVLIAFSVYTGGDLHAGIMAALALGLLGSFNWYLRMVQQIKEQQAEAAPASGTAAADATPHTQPAIKKLD